MNNLSTKFQVPVISIKQTDFEGKLFTKLYAVNPHHSDPRFNGGVVMEMSAENAVFTKVKIGSTVDVYELSCEMRQGQNGKAGFHVLDISPVRQASKTA